MRTEYSIDYATESGQPDEATFEEPDHWLDIAPVGSSSGYRDMQDFIATIREPDVAERFDRCSRTRRTR